MPPKACDSVLLCNAGVWEREEREKALERERRERRGIGERGEREESIDEREKRECVKKCLVL